MDLSFELGAFSGWAPLFPLPDVVMLPGALLALHVFEPRYRVLLRDALEGEKLVAMALLLPGYEATYEHAPGIAPWVGLGRIVAHEPLASGRSNLLVAGLRRARVLEEDRSRPYRRGRLAVAGDDEAELDGETSDALALRTSLLLERVPPRLVRDPVRLGVARRIHVPLGVLLDLAADALRLTTGERQSLLELPSVADRASRFIAVVSEKLTGHDARFYPAGFSDN